MKDLLEKLNIDQLSEMQEEMVEKTKGNPNSDLLLLSPTGSGKTLAYLISAMRHVDYSDPSIQVLVVTPSRELALQSNDLLLRMKSPLRSQCLIGGHAHLKTFASTNSSNRKSFLQHQAESISI